MPAPTTFNSAAAITKSDTVNFTRTSDAIYVGGAGIAAVVFEDESVVNFTCAIGQLLPLKAKRVNSTTTTATLMVTLNQL